jgi:uncharacterized metal-binding protein YceD (DUF177 family)
MDDRFKIYVDRLRDHDLKIHETFKPDFLDVKEEHLKFSYPVALKGEAYLADDTLVMHLNVATEAEIPCSVCNEMTKVEIAIPEFYLAVPLNEIKGGIYDYSEALREEIVLAVPQFAECSGGTCPQRKELEKFLKKPGENDSPEEERYHPFADL